LPPHPSDPSAIPGVTETRGAVAVSLRLARIPNGPFELWVGIYNGQQAPLEVDVGKFFMLDDSGRQLAVLTLPEFEYELYKVVARNWRGGGYVVPVPPPQPRRYIIHGTEYGTYEVAPDLGGSTDSSGHPTATYGAKPQADFASSFIEGFALGQALQGLTAARANERLARAAQGTLETFRPIYFTSDTPLLPGENRQGQFFVVPFLPRETIVSVKVVLFVLNPNTSIEEPWEFRFR